MRPAEVVRRGADYLARHGVEAPLVDAERLMMVVLGTDRAGLYSREEGLRSPEAKAFGRALCRRCVGTPLQHLTGTTTFRGLELVVRPGVFIPRPETEVLVDVDVGTGTGAVALAIKDERPDASVSATDVSPEAVGLARENAERLRLAVDVFVGDLLEALPQGGRLDLVVANPPYVPVADARELPAEVRADPPEALFGGPEIYRRLFAQASGRLVPGGSVVVEIHERDADRIRELAIAEGLTDLEVRQDLAGRDRVVRARRP